MDDERPLIGITMGDPVGIGPEILLRALSAPALFEHCRPLIIGDPGVLNLARDLLELDLQIHAVTEPAAGRYTPGILDVLSRSRIAEASVQWGRPCVETAKAMVDYITCAAGLARRGILAAMVTCPINKTAMQTAGVSFNGHTELLAHQTGTGTYAMMLAGSRLRVVLVTIHAPLSRVPNLLTEAAVLRTIRITHESLISLFGIVSPRLAVAGLNPHCGEGGKFGHEEIKVIRPAVRAAQATGWNISGPLPPDTVYFQAIEGQFDAVVSMYHDQGLIPFKLVHFKDGVNVTLGLPIIRTSVDHGTAYDIAGKNRADCGSLTAAISMATGFAALRRYRR